MAAQRGCVPRAAVEADREPAQGIQREPCWPRKLSARGGDVSLVCHEHRHGHVVQDGAGDAAEHQLAQARMAVRAHHQKIAAAIRDVRQDDIGDVEIARLDALDLDLDAVAGKMQRDVGARLLAVTERPSSG